MKDEPRNRPGTVDMNSVPSFMHELQPLSMVYGGGGIFGIGYCVGVAHGLEAGGVPVSTAPALGTSAGSWAASAMALGCPPEHILGLEAPPIPNRKTNVLADIARELFGEATHPLVTVSAVTVRTRRRHILDGGRYPLADLVAASSAVPGLLPPHRIDGRLYVDGGMWSATSIDSAANSKSVIVVAPLAGPHMGPIGRGAGYLLGRELHGWHTRHRGRHISLIRPSRAIAKIAGVNPMNLFDAERGREVFPLAYEQGLKMAAEMREHVPA